MKWHLPNHQSRNGRSHPARGGWIEIPPVYHFRGVTKSHPARGGWIEMHMMFRVFARLVVPPRKGWVD